MAKPTSNEQGAPAALRAIEEHELQCRKEKDAAHREWKEKLEKLVLGDEVSEQDERRAKRIYLEALEIWDDATKRLALYDKQIAPEKREGEKILVYEAKEIFAQLTLSIRLGIESYMTGIAQNAFQCATAEEFYTLHAEHYRAAMATAIEAAKREGVIPNWIE